MEMDREEFIKNYIYKCWNSPPRVLTQSYFCNTRHGWGGG